MTSTFVFMSECVGFNTPTRRIIGQFGDKSFQAIDCIGAVDQKQLRKQNTTYTWNTTDKQRTLSIANKTKPLFWCDFTTSGYETERVQWRSEAWAKGLSLQNIA